MSLVPATGDVWIADLEPVRGSEQGRLRPVVIFQNPALSRFTSTLLAVPVTSNQDRLGVVGTCFLAKSAGGLSLDSVALAFQVRAIDRARLTKRLGKLAKNDIEAVADAILAAFGIKVSE